MMTALKRPREQVNVHLDDVAKHGDSTEDETDDMDESMAAREDSANTGSDDDETVDEAVLEDMERFEASFKNISQRYRLINRIGEGTFSTVYKAEDLLYEHYDNGWDQEADKENRSDLSNKHKPNERTQRPRFVAIKKIYVTSSPSRIMNELELLYALRESPNVCPLITAFRHQDQVIAVLPFFQHQDFREYYRDMSISDVRVYLRCLFTALASVHEAEIIHRDIKPTNFLYSPSQQRGVLVDFGLAEREGTDQVFCNCCYKPHDRRHKIENSVYASKLLAAQQAGQTAPHLSFPSSDSRSSRRANRAGTRGFRAPEVLLKCTAQTCLIDVWACGIILLTFLSKRFPFFHSVDDIDAFIELCCIFGKKRMRETALLHGQVMHTNLPTLTEAGPGWERIILWSTNRNKKGGENNRLSQEEQEAVDFMRCCLELDPANRISAEDALHHPFLEEEAEDRLAEDGRD